MSPARTLQKAGAPAIVPRSGWNADEKIRRAAPSFAPALRLALVHHTAGANGYTAAQSPAIVRAIQLYHVKGNGWNDIGYNFLVDRFGQVFEGRYGGIERNVVGAHAEGFNTGSVGVALLGEYSSLAVAQKARDALARAARVAARRRARRPGADALVHLRRQRALPGRPAGLPAHGLRPPRHRLHRLPRQRALRPARPRSRATSSRRGLPKLYAPLVTGTVPGTVRFRARLSSPLPWTVEVYDAAGAVVASWAGFGPNVDWTLGRDAAAARQLLVRDPVGGRA